MSPQYWVFFWNFESEKFSGETKNFQAKIKIGQAELMNGHVFKSTFRTLQKITFRPKKWGPAIRKITLFNRELPHWRQRGAHLV